MKRQDAAALAAHLAQHRLAVLAQWLAGLAGLVAAYWCGWSAILLGAAAVWFFGLAKPGPSEHLDHVTRE